MSTPKQLSGSCLCGNITYTGTSAPQHLDHCYCITCQKVSGEPYIAWTGIARISLTWTFKRDPFKWRAPIADTGMSVSERTCCGNCGCNVILQYDLYPEKTHVAAATIRRNDFALPAVGCHIWTKCVPEGYIIPEDGVVRYGEFDGEFQALLEESLRGKKKD